MNFKARALKRYSMQFQDIGYILPTNKSIFVTVLECEYDNVASEYDL